MSNSGINEETLPDIYFLPRWGDLYQEHDKAKVDIFRFENNDGHVYYQFMRRPLPRMLDHDDFCDLVTPYGFSGPIVLKYKEGRRSDLVRQFDYEFQEYCYKNKIVSEYIRFSPWLKNHLDFSDIYETRYNNYTLYTDLSTSDFFMNEFSSKARNHVRKAMKNGVELQFDYTGETIEEFQRLYDLMMTKNKVNDYYIFDTDFLRKTFDALPDKQFLINAIYQNKVISSSFFIYHLGHLHYHLTANDPNYYFLHANSLILFEAGKWGKGHGMKQMHLGGAFSESLFKFKQEFTKKEKCDFHIGMKIRNQEVFDRLVELRKKQGDITNEKYFPLYRG